MIARVPPLPSKWLKNSRQKVWKKIAPKDLSQIKSRHGRLSASGRWQRAPAEFDQDSLEGIFGLLVPDEVLQQTGSLSLAAPGATSARGC